VAEYTLLRGAFVPNLSTLRAALLGAALLSFPAQAAASYANFSLGISAGFTRYQWDQPIAWGLPFALEAGYYIDNGFELYLRVPFSIGYATTGIPLPGGTVGAGPVVGTGGTFGVRYLFSQEDLRPWAGLHFTGAIFAYPMSPPVMVGPGLNVGVEYFVSESISIGARGFFDFLMQVNGVFQIAPSFGGALYAATYF